MKRVMVFGGWEAEPPDELWKDWKHFRGSDDTVKLAKAKTDAQNFVWRRYVDATTGEQTAT